ncbi:MAG: VWA domain-containing protein [Ardenticatenaceae bacterium]|nr:VWA domain-containing protein [Ardenticatenaceae bacterium]
MNFLWPWLLLFLLIIPLSIAIYIWMLRRRRKFAVRYSSLSLIREALPKSARWRQHLPFALFLLGLTGLIGAFARPVAEVEVPLSRTTIILALDVSRSMCATDVDPNRLAVAQDAALAFVEEQADGTQIGLVAFAGFAELVVPPTNDKEVLREAIATLTTSLGTAIGSATLKAIDAISEVNTAVPPSGLNLQTDETVTELAENYQPDIIVLLTDGANSQGPLPLDAAQQAADRQVRVYTIGFGTDEIPEMVCTQAQLGGDVFNGRFGGGGFGGGFGGGGGGNFRRFLVIDEETLQGVADMTGGEYYRAESAEQLLEVFEELPTQIILQKEAIEISVFFVMAAVVFVGTAVFLSLKWRRYP